MTFGVSAIAYKGYGKFVPRWLNSIAAQSRKVDQVVVVVAGDDHGLHHDFKPPSFARIIRTDLQPHGDLHAIGIEALDTDWVMYFSVDDIFQTHAFQAYEDFLTKHPYTDVLVTSWTHHDRHEPVRTKRSALPQNASKVGKGFICGHALFKKEDWEENKWPPRCDFPALFLFPNLVEKGKTFCRLDKPTWTYLRRPDSRHRVLSREKRRQAKLEHNASLKRMRAFYGD